MESGRAKIRGTELVWDRDGPRGGTPVVWGHGLTSSRANEDRLPLVDASRLRSQHDVIRYDARGHGESAPLAEPAQGSWAELALDQQQLVEHLGLDEVVLAGVSMGVGTALHTAVAWGDRVEKLVLVIPPTGWEERGAQVAQYEQMAQIIEAKGVEPLIAASASLAPPDPFVGDDDWKQLRAEAMRSADPVRLAANFRGAAYADLPALDELAALTVPTLVLAWSGDPGHPVSTAERLGDTLDDVVVVVASSRQEMDRWTELTLDFLADD